MVTLFASPALPGSYDTRVELVKDPTAWMDTTDVSMTGPSFAAVAMVIVFWLSRTPVTGNFKHRLSDVSQFEPSPTLTCAPRGTALSTVKLTCTTDSKV